MSEKIYWAVEGDASRPSLRWDCLALPEDHTDTIEMSGLFASYIVTYGISGGHAVFRRNPVFPMLRLRPNDTHASFQQEIPEDAVPALLVNGAPLVESPVSFLLDGTVTAYSVCGDLSVIRRLFPTVGSQAVCEWLSVRNDGSADVTLSLSGSRCARMETVMGCMGMISSYAHASLTLNGVLVPEGETVPLRPGDTAAVCCSFSGHMAMEADPADGLSVPEEYEKRLTRVRELMTPLTLDTGNTTLDAMFAFAKVRAGESIFRTSAGDIHCPGGGAYYAAVWCNDQVEYAGPWHAYTGDPIQVGAAYNAYAWYYSFMDTYDQPIPSSVIAEKVDYWNCARDRGDAAMYLYGASRYALTSGNLGENRKLWRAIQWCAGYCLHKKNEAGVIESDSDELEGRLPSGKANLCTNMLTLGGLRYAASLADALKEPETASLYRREADALEIACEAYFAANIHGFETYKYYETNTTLRSWICMPLCVGITSRASGTAAAIASPYLMSDAGQLSEEGTDIAWDRSTLYGLRGMFRAGKTEEGWAYLSDYCEKRLLGRHVPYAVEAWPEGGMRHLSAESALFCQILTEGILRIEPLSFTSFSFCPVLPGALDHLTVRGIHAFGEIFDLCVRDHQWTLTTASGKTLRGTDDKPTVVRF